MRIIFLDLDGVVVPFGSYSSVDVGLVRSSPHAHVDLLVSKTPLTPVDLLLKLADRLDARFVLISSWRGVFPASFIQAYLSRLGLFDRFHDDWFALMRGLPPLPVKGRDIGEWLGDHKGIPQRDCLVLDDEDLELRERWGFRVLKQVRPSPGIGFSRDDLDLAFKIFRVEEEV